ncbi:DUF1330 domain-containing protein [Celeribacter sp.]|uniref:DUF1330 domain-containing protein n=1 Tax=Celeribacter sp. TaxID=1890673 RepID=UPI003A9375ED
MAYYIVAHADVRDIETYRRYAERAEELMVQHGARVLVGGVRGRYVEGNGPKRHSIVVFPDEASADACYMSDAYQEILPLAMRSATRNVVVVNGPDVPELFKTE